MTFPVVAARTTTADAAATTSRAINLGSPSAGELIVVFATTQSAGGAYLIDTSASGDGWYVTQAVGSVNARIAVFAKVATGSDALTIQTLGSVRMVAICYRITGHGSALAAAFSNGITVNGNPPEVTISGAAQDVLFLTALGTTNSAASAPPAGYGTMTTAAIAPVVAIASAERNLNGTSDNPGTFTNSVMEWIAATVAVHEIAVTTSARLTQETVETASDATPAARITQVSAEVASNTLAVARITQIAVEVASRNVTDAVGPGMLFIAT